MADTYLATYHFDTTSKTLAYILNELEDSPDTEKFELIHKQNIDYVIEKFELCKAEMAYYKEKANEFAAKAAKLKDQLERAETFVAKTLIANPVIPRSGEEFGSLAAYESSGSVTTIFDERLKETGDLVPIAKEFNIDPKYIKTETIVKTALNKAMIKDDLIAGKDLAWAFLVEKPVLRITNKFEFNIVKTPKVRRIK